MPTRPRIPSHLAPVHRTVDTVQLGLHPDAVVLTGLTSADTRVLRAMDGTRSTAELESFALSVDLPAERVRELLDLLAAHDALDRQAKDRATLWRRSRRHVLVGGDGPLTLAITQALRREHLGRVCNGEWAVDHHDLSLGHRVPPSCQRPIDVALVVGRPDLDPDRLEPWLRHGIPHVAVRCEGTRASIGPLVVGRVRDQPCMRCLELHQCDLDPAHALVLHQARSQLAGSAAHVDPSAATFVASVVTSMVTGYLDGVGLPLGVSVEVSTPWPRVDYRRWQRHPRCPAHPERDGGLPAAPEPTRLAPSDSRETMAG